MQFTPPTFSFFRLGTSHKYIQVKNRKTKCFLNWSAHSSECKYITNVPFFLPLYFVRSVFSYLSSSIIFQIENQDYPGWPCLCVSTDCCPLACTLHKGQVCGGSWLTNALPGHVFLTDRKKGRRWGLQHSKRAQHNQIKHTHTRIHIPQQYVLLRERVTQIRVLGLYNTKLFFHYTFLQTVSQILVINTSSVIKQEVALV